MCNDRNHQKIRSLANYCFDLRFQRPRVEQIKVQILPSTDPSLYVKGKLKKQTKKHLLFFLTFQASMMSIAYKEGIKIPPPALNEMILASNQDVRQVKKVKTSNV